MKTCKEIKEKLDQLQESMDNNKYTTLIKVNLASMVSILEWVLGEEK